MTGLIFEGLPPLQREKTTDQTGVPDFDMGRVSSLSFLSTTYEPVLYLFKMDQRTRNRRKDSKKNVTRT